MKPSLWRLKPLQTEKARALAQNLRVDPVIGQLLLNRGVDDVETAGRFLERRLGLLHDPELLPGIPEAADRIHRAVAAGKKICVYGDYDVDGMCGIAILLECLQLAGASPRYHVPLRLEDGYGVNAEALRKLREEGVDLVITVDCGIASVAEALVAREIGLEYIVTDHHQFAPTLPEADVLVHPSLPDSPYPCKNLCGAGVAYKLSWELARRFSGARKTSEAFRQFLLSAIGLAAMGTVCDVVPLSDENRVLVYHGLQALLKSPPLGLAKLMESANVGKRDRLNSGDLGFMLGPRLNACGRLGQARLGVELLVTRDEQKARELVRYLEEENKRRQTLERRIFTEAREMAEELYDLDSPEDSGCLILANDQWHVGVVGIVAGRMMERYHRPCILLGANGKDLTGSGRSISGFDLYEAVNGCRALLERFGGHAKAVGLTVTRENLVPLRDQLRTLATAGLAGELPQKEVTVDLEVPLSVLTPRLVKSFDVLEPFGEKNPSPLFLATSLQLNGPPRLMGGGERHMSFEVRQNGVSMRAVAFNQAERADELAANDQCCLLFQPRINDFRGYENVELHVRDLRAGPVIE